jgi:hypothetical protein
MFKHAFFVGILTLSFIPINVLEAQGVHANYFECSGNGWSDKIVLDFTSNVIYSQNYNADGPLYINAVEYEGTIKFSEWGFVDPSKIQGVAVTLDRLTGKIRVAEINRNEQEGDVRTGTCMEIYPKF